MAHASSPENPSYERMASARAHALLRFGAGVAAAFVLSEAMEWQPTFLAPVLVATLLPNFPASPPLKMGLVLVVVMAVAALVAFVLSSILRGFPEILFGAISLIVFLAFLMIAQGGPKLPALLLLICISTIPVITMIAPASAGVFPIELVRSTLVAMLMVWCAHAIWPAVTPRAPPPAPAPVASPLITALVGTAIVMPLMLVFLMFGLADALPVLITTVFLVTNFDVEQGQAHGLAMIMGNLIGGLVGMVAHWLLMIAPSLISLAVIVFIIAMGFATRIERGGAAAAVAMITCNSTLIILSSAILSGPSNSGIWLTRLAQFAFACAFAIGMMSLVWRRKTATEP